MESKKFVIVKNHVRELTIENEDLDNEDNSQNHVEKSMKKTQAYTSDTEAPENVSSISGSDLVELRTVYMQCKAVISKIETKYGHLLNINDKKSARKSLKEKGYIEECCCGFNKNAQQIENAARKSKLMEKGYIEECSCGMNKKIIFDDDGQQIEKERMLDGHLCPKKFKLNSNTNNNWYEETVKMLPDDIASLVNILRNSDISLTYRNKVIKKMMVVKQDFLNEVRFNKPSFKEKLKSNPEEIFEFAGANLFSLPGYPDWK